jgi:hypothetical protein
MGMLSGRGAGCNADVSGKGAVQGSANAFSVDRTASYAAMMSMYWSTFIAYKRGAVSLVRQADVGNRTDFHEVGIECGLEGVCFGITSVVGADRGKARERQLQNAIFTRGLETPEMESTEHRVRSQWQGRRSGLRGSKGIFEGIRVAESRGAARGIFLAGGTVRSAAGSACSGAKSA